MFERENKPDAIRCFPVFPIKKIIYIPTHVGIVECVSTNFSFQKKLWSCVGERGKHENKICFTSIYNATFRLEYEYEF